MAFAAAAVALSVPAQAYYHYVYFSSRSGPFVPIRAQYNLAALNNNTLPFFVSDSGPSGYYPNDTFGSVLGEIKQAIAVWNGVNGSNLHVAFGGLESASQTANTPGVDVVFQDLGPGVIGMGTPNLPVNPAVMQGPNGPFVPIVRGTVILTNNTGFTVGVNSASHAFPSFSEGFFTTVVHEIGHALGLQHTWTGSAMSQDDIRNTSRARPIDADDIAAFLALYGAPGWSVAYGSIAGTVNFNNNGGPVNLASVVAISPTGPAISSLTNPDGSYQIQGLPAGSYQVYVHPLPPDAIVSNGSGLATPHDLTGREFPASGPFAAQFYPGTQNWQAAQTVNVAAGGAPGQANFTVQGKSAVPMYNMLTYSYAPNNSAYYAPTYVNTTAVNVAAGSGFTIETEPECQCSTPTASTIGLLGIGNNSSIQSAGLWQWFVNFNLPATAQTPGPRHLVYSIPGDMYVLPDGVIFTLQGPPSISSVFPNADGSITLTGTNFAPDSRVFFDGLPATKTTFSGGTLVATPPPANPGQVATLTVFNSDGQNSMFLQSANPPTYAYPFTAAGIGVAAGLFSVSPQALTAGITSAVQITAPNMNFTQGPVSVGFGTSDVLVNNVWVIGPTQLLVNVTVSPSAAIGNSEISIVSGYQTVSVPMAFATQPANASLPEIAWPAVNATTGGAVNPGSYASIFPANGTQFPANPQLTLNGISLAIQYSSPTQINFFVPSTIPVGPANLTFLAGGNSVSIVVEIDNPNPTLVGQVKK
jgi:hypothetical protein